MAELTQWLATCGASEYSTHFQREGFRTVEEVVESGMTQLNLTDMGVSDGQVRNNIIMAMFRFSSSSQRPGTLALWLGDIGCPYLLDNFQREGFQSLSDVVDQVRRCHSYQIVMWVEVCSLNCAAEPATE